MTMAGKSSPAPVLITGMHRSGTSFVASLLRSSGVDIGSHLMPPAADNPRGFFENLDFVGFHERWLRLNGYDPAGWLAPQSFELPDEAAVEAAEIIARNEKPGPWGWKDPRTTLFLDFWASLVPNAGYVILYREPSEVVDSLFRRGDGPVMATPELAARSWLAHNSTLLRFVRANRAQCMLANVKVIARDPQRFLRIIGDRFRLEINASVVSPFEPYLMKGFDAAESQPTLLRYLMPEVDRLFIDLELEADLAGGVHREGAITSKRARDAFFTGWAASHSTSAKFHGAIADGALEALEESMLLNSDFNESLARLRGSFEQYQSALSEFSKRLNGEVS